MMWPCLTREILFEVEYEKMRSLSVRFLDIVLNHVFSIITYAYCYHIKVVRKVLVRQFYTISFLTSISLVGGVIVGISMSGD